MYSVVVGVFLPSDATDSIFGHYTKLAYIHVLQIWKSKSPTPRTTQIDKLKILKSYDRHETERPELLEKKKAAR